MEVSTITLMKESVYDDDEESRLSKITKAITQITTLLPFVKQMRALISDNSFLKYLFLNIPILKGSSIIMIIDTLIYNYHQEDVFQKNFCAAIEYVAKIQDFLEMMGVDSPASNVNAKEHYFRASVMRQEFCLEISGNKIYLKEKTLRHFKIFIEHFVGENKPNAEKNLQKDIIDILKIFLKFTYSEKIITKVASLLEKLRGHWKENWLNGKLDFEVEEIIISKSILYLKTNNDIIGSEDVSKDDIVYDEAMNSNITSQQEVVKESDSPKKYKPEKEEDEHAKVFDNLIEIEEWLITEKEVPSISKNNYISDFFKIQGNFECFLKFLFDPFHIKLNKTWVIEYPFLTEETDTEHLIAFKNNQIFQSHPLIRKKVPTRFNIYIFRSYKVYEILSDFRNFRFIYSTNPKAIEIFCHGLFLSLRSEGFLCEINHIAHLIEVFLRRDAESMLAGLFQYNILKFLLYYLNFPKVMSLFINILNFMGPRPIINEIQGLKVMKQLINNDFFLEISQAVLTGKWNVKPFFVRSSINDSNVHADLTQIKNEINLEFYPLFEELSAFSSDIDRLKELVLEKKKHNLFKNTSKKILTLQKMSMIVPFSKKLEESPIIKSKKSLVLPNFSPTPTNHNRFSQNSIDINLKLKFPHLNDKPMTEPQILKTEQAPLRSYEQYLIRKGSDLHYTDWEKFNTIYPSNTELLRETSLDKISKSPEFTLKEISSKDFECGLLMELISFLIRSTFESHDNEKIKNLIGLPKRNSDLILQGLFKSNTDFFNNLMKAFLIKSKLILKEPYPSSIVIGESVNLILKAHHKPWFELLRPCISQISRKNFMFLQKTIMNSYTWCLAGQITIIRLLLIEQLSLIIKNEGNYVLDETLEGLWDTLIKYFLEFKQQNLYQRYFLNIIETALNLKNQRVIMIIFLKMNLLNTLSMEIHNAMKNQVLTNDVPMAGFFFVSKSIIKSLENTFLDESFPFRSQIIALNSWKTLSKKYGNSRKSIILNVDLLKNVEAPISMKNFDSERKSKISLKLNFENKITKENSLEKIKPSSSNHTSIPTGFGSITKSSTTTFLASPRIRTPMSSSRTIINQVIKDNKKTSHHIKSKTMSMNDEFK